MMPELIQMKDYTQAQVRTLERKLCSEYPQLRNVIIGRSCLGKPITAFCIGRGEPILMVGAFHGSERLTGLLLLLFLDDFCRHIEAQQPMAGIRIERVLENRCLTVIPYINPDGCDIALLGETAGGHFAPLIHRITNGVTTHYNANARGVDLNHNFPAGWEDLHKLEQAAGIYGPSPTRYGGSAPGSEPETICLMELCKQARFRHVLAFHSQGEVIYHRYGKRNSRADKMAQILSSSSGYTLEEPTALATGGGFKDYFIDCFERPGFTIEVGLGENPLPVDEVTSIYRKLQEMLVLSIMM